MMARLAREISAAVGLFDAPAFVPKLELLCRRGHLSLLAGAQLVFVQGIDVLEHFDAPMRLDITVTAMA
jgi:hypothetical protein